MQRKIRQGRWKNKKKKHMIETDMKTAILSKQKKLLLESVRNSTICSLTSRMYYQYFTFKGLDYTRSIIFSLIFFHIFLQLNIFRKLRITVISSSQWNVVSAFWVILGNVHCRLIKPLILGGYSTIITRFILHFSKMFLCFICCVFNN